MAVSSDEDRSDSTKEIREAIEAAIHEYFAGHGLGSEHMYFRVKSANTYLTLGPTYALASDSKYGVKPPYGTFISLETANTELTEEQVTQLIGLGWECDSGGTLFTKGWLQPDDTDSDEDDFRGDYVALTVGALVDVYGVRTFEDLLVGLVSEFDPRD